MLGETEIYTHPAAPHGPSQGRPESPFKDSMERGVHRKSLPRVYRLLCGRGVLGNTEFYQDFCPLCKCLVGSGSWQEEMWGTMASPGLSRGSRITSEEKDAPLNTKCVFLSSLPDFTFFSVHFKQRESKSLLAVKNIWG